MAAWVLDCWLGSAHNNPLGSCGTFRAGSSPRTRACTRNSRRPGAGAGKGPRRLSQRWVQHMVQRAQRSWHGTDRHSSKSDTGGRSQGRFLFDSLAGLLGQRGTAGRSPRCHGNRAGGAVGLAKGPGANLESWKPCRPPGAWPADDKAQWQWWRRVPSCLARPSQTPAPPRSQGHSWVSPAEVCHGASAMGRAQCCPPGWQRGARAEHRAALVSSARVL